MEFMYTQIQVVKLGYCVIRSLPVKLERTEVARVYFAVYNPWMKVVLLMPMSHDAVLA